MKILNYFYCILALLCIVSVDSAVAQIPRTISYQGMLLDQSGPIPDGNHPITIKIYTTSGNELYSETQSVAVVKGQFSVLIGSATPIPPSVKFDAPYLLGIAVEGGAELVPRTPFTSAPYALHATVADQANSLASSATGIVTSVNELSGPISIQGSGGTTVTKAGNTVTVSSNSSNGNAQLTLPYLQILPHPATLFSLNNTGLGGVASFKIINDTNTAVALYAESNGKGGAAYFFKPKAGPDAALTVQGGFLTSSPTLLVRNDGSGSATTIANNNPSSYSDAMIVTNIGQGRTITATSSSLAGTTTSILGQANSVSVGVNAGAGVSGVVGMITSKTPGDFSAGVRGINNSQNTLGSGVIGYQAGSGSGVYGETPKGVGVYGRSNDSAGVRGESVLGSGVEASYIGAGTGTALTINNGAIKLSGATKAAFIHRITASNIVTVTINSSVVATEISNPLCDGDPNCFVFITHVLNPSGTTQIQGATAVFYSTVRGKWVIFNQNNSSIAPSVGAQFNVLVIKQ